MPCYCKVLPFGFTDILGWLNSSAGSIGSHFILSGFKYYVLTFKNKYVLMLYCKSLLLLLRCDAGKVRDRCGGMGRFKGGFRGRDGSAV